MAETTGTQWGQSFTYYGFGNLLAQTVTKGSAPSLSVLVSGTTNRITTSGYSYDSNGNLTAAPGLTMTYDVENRTVSATSSSGTEYYAYGPSNERVWKRIEYSGGGSTNFVYFYGADGALLTTGGIDDDWDYNVYFAGRQVWREWTGFSWSMPPMPVSPDRLGSTVKHFPYGDEPTATAPNREKFATYYRDQISTLDYARNRYYSSTIARFTTADPYGGSARPGAPQTWNRYSYVGGDPVNFNDPSGLDIYDLPWTPNWGLIYALLPNTNFFWVTGTAPVPGGEALGVFGPYGGGPAELLPGTNDYSGSSSWEDGSMSQRIPLPFAQATAILTAFSSLAGLVLNQGEDCNTNVIGKLGTALGFDVTAFAAYLQNGATFLDGTVSTAPIAGTITSTAAANVMYGPDATVAGVFGANQGGLQVNALTSITASYLTVYMRPSSVSLEAGGLNASNLALLFHEALHGYGGSLGGTSYFDSQIQEAFFGAGSSQVGAATANITEYIQTHYFH